MTPLTDTPAGRPSEEEHRRLLREVFTLGPAFSQAVVGLRGLGWDGRQDVERFTAADASGVLRRLLDGSVDAGEIERWADAIESREDVELDPADEDQLSNLLFELSTPAITSPAPEVAAAWLARYPM